jgi:hypothetical protein
MTVKELILSNPTATRKEIAKLSGTSEAYVKNVFSAMRYAGEIPAYKRPVSEPAVTASKDQQPAIVVNIKEPEDLKAKVKDYVKKNERQSVGELADYFDCGPSRMKTLVSELIAEGHTLSLNDSGEVLFSTTIPKAAPTVLNIDKMSTGFYRFGLTGDNHLCSRYERLDVLNALYDEFERQGITTVLNTGNWIDGEARFNKHDLHTHGMGHQIEYFLKAYPQRSGMVTQLITGDDHEGWYTQREGVDVGRIMQMEARRMGREDLFYIGHMEADIILPAKNGQTKVRVLHPGGGSSYAISYTSQKIVESYTGNEKPDILVDGHYHKAGYNFIRGVHVVQTGCTQDQTPFMRKKRLAAHLGGWIIEFKTDDNGAVTSFKQEWMPFYDKAYYNTKTNWEYQW